MTSSEDRPGTTGAAPPAPDAMVPLAHLTEITQSLSASLMASIQAIDQLGQRMRAIDEQQRRTQLCVAKALLALGTMAQAMPDDTVRSAVFTNIEDALKQIRKQDAAG